MNREERRKRKIPSVNKTIKGNQQEIVDSHNDAIAYGVGYMEINAKGEIRRVHPRKVIVNSGFPL